MSGSITVTDVDRGRLVMCDDDRGKFLAKITGISKMSLVHHEDNILLSRVSDGAPFSRPVSKLKWIKL